MTSVSSNSKHPQESEAFYSELTSRNQHFVSKNTQTRLSHLKVVVAGCGAAGGACIEPLVRLGVRHFRLADNGAYELTNLNRQHTFVDQIGTNKASFHAGELLRINPFADVKAFTDGISAQNINELVSWADLIIDAVDVTTPDAIKLKFVLHEKAHAARKPVLTPLDPGFCQMGYGYDYRNAKTPPVHGRLEACKAHQHPIKALLEMFPLSEMPTHTLPLIRDLLTLPGIPASQLGCAADLLAGVICAAVLRFADTGTLISSWSIDLAEYAISPSKRLNLWIKSFGLRKEIRKLLRKLP